MLYAPAMVILLAFSILNSVPLVSGTPPGSIPGNGIINVLRGVFLLQRNVKGGGNHRKVNTQAGSMARLLLLG